MPLLSNDHYMFHGRFKNLLEPVFQGRIRPAAVSDPSGKDHKKHCQFKYDSERDAKKYIMDILCLNAVLLQYSPHLFFPRSDSV